MKTLRQIGKDYMMLARIGVEYDVPLPENHSEVMGKYWPACNEESRLKSVLEAIRLVQLAGLTVTGNVAALKIELGEVQSYLNTPYEY